MTGEEIKGLFNDYIDETGSGFFDNDSLNDIFRKANINIVERKIEEFQATKKVSVEMAPLIIQSGSLTPTNATIDLSSLLTNYYKPINFYVTSPYRSTTHSAYAKDRPYSEFNTTYTAGVARFPRVYLRGQLAVLEPANAMAVVVTYLRTPVTIDVTDNIVDIGYNEKLTMLLIAEAMNVAGVKGRDPFIIQASQADERQNP